MAHDSDRPGAGHHGCDHDCQTCGAAPVSGLAACPYCRAAYPDSDPGVVCPGCACVSLKGRTACAQCKASLTRTCVFCNAATLLDVHACTRCHEPFAGAEERKRARAAGRAPTMNNDPTGANIFNSLNSILKS
jgi:hypothetical protein